MDGFSSPKRGKNDFFKSLKPTVGQPELTEVDFYFADTGEGSEETSSLKKFPLLRQIYRRFNAALPSSASCERLFSVSGRIFSPLKIKSSSLSDNQFERLVFLKINNFSEVK